MQSLSSNLSWRILSSVTVSFTSHFSKVSDLVLREVFGSNPLPEHQELCIPADVPTSHRSRYLLTRSVIIRHLFNHLNTESTTQVHVFPSLKSNAFNQYLNDTPVHFIMAHDGKVAGKGVDTEADLRTMVLLRSTILWFTTQSRNPLNVALINTIEFRDSKVCRPINILPADTNWKFRFSHQSSKESMILNLQPGSKTS